jgi:3'-phosphoadenosine 5'-phosphosulfate sulfotransferase (PAPS reductase)/FAD synthetase
MSITPQLDGPAAGLGGKHDVVAVDHLDALESEAIHIFREVAGEFDRPVILFSGGKDSTVSSTSR